MIESSLDVPLEGSGLKGADKASPWKDLKHGTIQNQMMIQCFFLLGNIYSAQGKFGKHLEFGQTMKLFLCFVLLFINNDIWLKLSIKSENNSASQVESIVCAGGLGGLMALWATGKQLMESASSCNTPIRPDYISVWVLPLFTSVIHVFRFSLSPSTSNHITTSVCLYFHMYGFRITAV